MFGGFDKAGSGFRKAGNAAVGMLEVGGDINMGVGQKIIMDDDGDTYMVVSSDNLWELWSGGQQRFYLSGAGTFRVNGLLNPNPDNSRNFGSPTLRWKNGYFSADLVLGIAQKFVMDDDDDSYWSASADDVCGGYALDIERIRFDADATAGNTSLSVYDVSATALARVSIGAADSGGVGYRVLRIPN